MRTWTIRKRTVSRLRLLVLRGLAPGSGLGWHGREVGL